MSDHSTTGRVLLTGATGYIGGRLLPVLEESGRPMRCLVRRPDHLRPRTHPTTEIVGGDVLDRASLASALRDVDTAYYLVHSMSSGDDFEEQDRRAAENFGSAARDAGVRRIVYLGGLGSGDDLSPHLRSRQEVGRIFRQSGVPTVELRASIVIGSGSASFEMVRALVEKLPVMILPRWVRTPTQPIAVEDVVAYLAAALDLPAGTAGIFEIGGADRVSYRNLMEEYARQRGLRRMMISVPLLTPHLSSLWLGLVTPVYARIGRELIEGLQNPTVVTDDRARQAFDVDPRGIREAIERARSSEDGDFAATRWSDALSSSGASRTWGGRRFGSRLVDSRTAEVEASAARAFAPIRRIGGDVGWYWGDWLWRTRGFLDLLVGGVGSRRGRRDPEWVRPGETVDFWRVEAVEPGRLLRLRAEMKLPGRAWLQFEVEPVEREGGDELPGGRPGRCRIRQTAIFDPEGLAGLTYWYGLYPIHALVFRGMLRGIVQAVEEG